MNVYALKFGESVLKESMIFQGGDKNKVRPISFLIFLIKADDRLILVDSGCDTMPGFEMKYFCGPEAVLKEAGVEPSKITDVIITHAHHDHIESVGLYKNAVIHIQKDELEKGRKYIPDDFKINSFDDEYTVYGSVKVIKSGGHSKGSCIVSFCANDKEYIITGDECYHMECLENKIPTGSSHDIEKSRAFIDKYSDKKYTCILCHEYSILPGTNGVKRLI